MRYAMPKRYAAHNIWGGIFEISADNKRFKCIVEPTHETWTGNNRSVAKDWLNCQNMEMGHHFTNREFPRTSAVPTFEFNGKTYVNMGAGELGFKKIRCVDNIDVYVRPME